jgi:hypothetical protein
LTPDIITPKASFYNPITYTKSKFLNHPNLHQNPVSKTLEPTPKASFIKSPSLLVRGINTPFAFLRCTSLPTYHRISQNAVVTPRPLPSLANEITFPPKSEPGHLYNTRANTDNEHLYLQPTEPALCTTKIDLETHAYLIM